MPKSYKRWKVREVNIAFSFITMSKRRPKGEKDHAYAQRACQEFLRETKRTDYDERSDKGWSPRMVEDNYSSDEQISVGLDRSTEENSPDPPIGPQIPGHERVEQVSVGLDRNTVTPQILLPIENFDPQIAVHEGGDDFTPSVDHMAKLSLESDFRVSKLFAESNVKISQILADSHIKCEEIRSRSEETCQRIRADTARELESMRLNSKEKIAQIEAENNLRIAELFVADDTD